MEAVDVFEGNVVPCGAGVGVGLMLCWWGHRG